MAILKMAKEPKQIPILKNITLPQSRFFACLLLVLFFFFFKCRLREMRRGFPQRTYRVTIEVNKLLVKKPF